MLVFAWGVQYKVSLYAGPHSAIRHMVKAKLLTNDKETPAAESSAFGASTPLVPVEFPLELSLTLFLGLALKQQYPSPVWEWRAQERSRQLCCGAKLNAIFYRPPPFRG